MFVRFEGEADALFSGFRVRWKAFFAFFLNFLQDMRSLYGRLRWNEWYSETYWQNSASFHVKIFVRFEGEAEAIFSGFRVRWKAFFAFFLNFFQERYPKIWVLILIIFSQRLYLNLYRLYKKLCKQTRKFTDGCYKERIKKIQNLVPSSKWINGKKIWTRTLPMLSHWQ